MPITRTNSKRYIGACDHPGCDYTTRVETYRINAANRLREHRRFNQHERAFAMKTPGKELPADEGLDKLSSYAGHLVVVGKDWSYEAAYDTTFGKREAILADVWVFVGNEWRNIGNVDAGNGKTPIFFKTVIKQLQDAGPKDAFGGLLVQGAEGRKNSREWIMQAPPTAMKKALDDWSPNF